MNETASTVIGVEPAAREFISARGGAVYAWIGWSGFLKVGLTRPQGVDFVELRGDEISLFVDRTIAPPAPHLGWHVSLRRWPRPRIKVKYASPESTSGVVDWIEVVSYGASLWP